MLMKRIFQTISLRKLKTSVNKQALNQLEGKEFIVLFNDGEYEKVYFKEDLKDILEKDHLRRIYYIFDLTDRIVVDRDILIKQ